MEEHHAQGLGKRVLSAGGGETQGKESGVIGAKIWNKRKECNVSGDLYRQKLSEKSVGRALEKPWWVQSVTGRKLPSITQEDGRSGEN